MLQPRMGGIIQANITDRNMLQASYMPFVSGGGLFIPSQQAVRLGQEVFVLATLPEQSQKIPLTGKVIPFNRSSCVYRYALPPDHVEFSTICR